ncbi:MAG: hypothetical protein KDC95_22245 [Planctomycetes bacterium]|nr:hypothetical protein [Planctomycetota bacterium]
MRDLLPKLRCPEKQSTLREATAAELDALNAKIAAGAVSTVGGEKVTEALDGALVRAEGDIAYPIRRDIPILIVEEGIALGS